MFPKAVMYSLKDVNVREFALNDPVAFLSQTQEMMFIDEAQKAPELFEYIQEMHLSNGIRIWIFSLPYYTQLLQKIAEQENTYEGQIISMIRPSAFTNMSG